MNPRILKISVAWALSLFTLLATFSTSLQAQQGDHQGVKHILHHGGGRPDSENIVITFLGDGFTTNNQAPFLERAQIITDHLVNNSDYPFSHFKDRITVYAIEVHSPQTNSPYNYFGTGNSLQPYPNSNRMRDMLLRHTPEVNIAGMIANYSSTAGWGLGLTVSGRSVGMALVGMGNSPGAYHVMFHEIGHTFGGLVDYYCVNGISGKEAPNMTADQNSNTIKWRAWFDIEGINFFTSNGCGSEWVTPSKNCMMQGTSSTSAYPLCKVCAAQILKNMAKITGETYQANSNITSANVPRCQTRIVEGAFHGCFHLQTVNIASTVASIGDYAFLRDTSLVTITNFATNPQTIRGNNTIFYGVDRKKISLRVPAGKEAAYEAAGWTGFKEIVAIGSDETEPCDGDCECKETPPCDCEICKPPVGDECTLENPCNKVGCPICGGGGGGNITGIPELVPANLLRAHVHHGLMYVSGLTKNETVSIYSVNGALVYQSIATSSEMNIPLRVQGVYVVKTGNRNIKVVYQ
jgi:hypothetical protein